MRDKISNCLSSHSCKCINNSVKWDIPYRPTFEQKIENDKLHYSDQLFFQIELSILTFVFNKTFQLINIPNRTPTGHSGIVPACASRNENEPEGLPLPCIFFPLMSNKLNFFFPCGAATNSAILPSHLPRKSWALSLCDDESLS